MWRNCLIVLIRIIVNHKYDFRFLYLQKSGIKMLESCVKLITTWQVGQCNADFSFMYHFVLYTLVSIDNYVAQINTKRNNPVLRYWPIICKSVDNGCRKRKVFWEKTIFIYLINIYLNHLKFFFFKTDFTVCKIKYVSSACKNNFQKKHLFFFQIPFNLNKLIIRLNFTIVNKLKEILTCYLICCIV